MSYLLTIKGYAPAGRQSDVEQWYDGLSPVQRMRVRTDRLEYLAKFPEHLWTMPYFERFTTGPCKGLGQIRLKVDRNHFRLVGFFGLGKNEFTIVRLIMKKSRTLSKNDCETAQKRRKRVEKNPELSHEWQF